MSKVRVTGPPSDRQPETELPPPPPGTEDERDPIAESESAARARRELRPVVVVPEAGMPYYVIRPPGMYPYGPTGVIVPGAVPGFVRAFSTGSCPDDSLARRPHSQGTTLRMRLLLLSEM